MCIRDRYLLRQLFIGVRSQIPGGLLGEAVRFDGVHLGESGYLQLAGCSVKMCIRDSVKGVQEAQPAARAAAAVADERGLIFTLYRKGGVYKPGALALLKYLHTLLTAYPVAAACADIVLRRVVKLDAGVLDWVLAALAEQTQDVYKRQSLPTPCAWRTAAK